MTDKEKIKAELEKLCIKYNEAIANPHFASYEAMLIAKGKQRQREDILNFINSLPEEQVSEDLLGIAMELEETIGTSPHSRLTIVEHLVKAANWQKEQMMMNDAITIKVGNEWGHPRYELDRYILEPLGIKSGDKVKLIIIKED